MMARISSPVNARRVVVRMLSCPAIDSSAASSPTRKGRPGPARGRPVASDYGTRR